VSNQKESQELKAIEVLLLRKRPYMGTEKKMEIELEKEGGKGKSTFPNPKMCTVSVHPGNRWGKKSVLARSAYEEEG